MLREEMESTLYTKMNMYLCKANMQQYCPFSSHKPRSVPTTGQKWSLGYQFETISDKERKGCRKHVHFHFKR